jgi:hypothetical protein
MNRMDLDLLETVLMDVLNDYELDQVDKDMIIDEVLAQMDVDN